MTSKLYLWVDDHGEMIPAGKIAGYDSVDELCLDLLTSQHNLIASGSFRVLYAEDADVSVYQKINERIPVVGEMLRQRNDSAVLSMVEG